jgi:gamma-glutamyltranspeptidase / glutathione hydrolase
MFEIDESQGLKYYETPFTKGYSAERGFKSIGVPGAVAGLFWSQRHFGRLPWAATLAPAIALAEAGVEVNWYLQRVIATNRDALGGFPDLAAVLLPGGKLPGTHDQMSLASRLVFPGLARVLREVAAKGAAGFYRGWVAQALVRHVQAGGGILSEADLAAYRPKILRETPRRYRHRRYITCYDQVGYEALNILDCFDLRAAGIDSLAYRHWTAEALAAAFTDSIEHYGDPDCVPESPVDWLASPELGAERARQISLEHALPRPVAPLPRGPAGTKATAEKLDPAWPPKLAGTTQVSAADAEGNMVTLCTSISAGFGSFVLVPETGIILNNGMGNFDPRPGRPNSIAPGKIPIFGVPELLLLDEDGSPAFTASGSGGYRITTGVIHTLLHWLDFGLSLPQAIEAPRLHCQGKATYVDSRVPLAIREQLARLGHQVVSQRDDPGLNAFGRVSAVTRDRRKGLLTAASGPAWAGSAGGI